MTTSYISDCCCAEARIVQSGSIGPPTMTCGQCGEMCDAVESDSLLARSARAFDAIASGKVIVEPHRWESDDGWQGELMVWLKSNTKSACVCDSKDLLEVVESVSRATAEGGGD